VKKTYIVAIVTVVYALAGVFLGAHDWSVAIPMILGASGLGALRAGVAKSALVPMLLACLALGACATSQQDQAQPSTVKPKADLGQSSTRATAAFLKSVATTDASGTLAPEERAVGGEVTVPFALWNPETKSWDVPKDENGVPYKVHATAVRDFNYLVGTISNSATVSGTASGSQTQGGTAGATGTQDGKPTNSPSTPVEVSGLPK